MYLLPLHTVTILAQWPFVSQSKWKKVLTFIQCLYLYFQFIDIFINLQVYVGLQNRDTMTGERCRGAGRGLIAVAHAVGESVERSPFIFTISFLAAAVKEIVSWRATMVLGKDCSRLYQQRILLLSHVINLHPYFFDLFGIISLPDLWSSLFQVIPYILFLFTCTVCIPIFSKEIKPKYTLWHCLLPTRFCYMLPCKFPLAGWQNYSC